MSRATTLPAVLSPKAPNTAISMLRALKQIKELLESIPSVDALEDDKVQASIDDVDVMISCID